MTYAQVHLETKAAVLAGLPDVLRGLSPASLVNLDWTDAELGLHGYGYWPVEEDTPALAPTERLTEGTLEVDAERGVVVRHWGAEALPEAELTALLVQAKGTKLAELNAECQRMLESLTPTYPERELTTFDKQESEARAYLAEGTASTPLLSALAQARGIELAELVQRVIAKADTFAAASGCIIGQRQALEDLLDAAETVEDVQAIVVSINLPGAA